MKKKFFSLLVAVLSIATNLWALDAPTMLKFVAPESGGAYYVDLGLSVKWAAWNVGADKPEGLGDLYAWGELVPKKDYSTSTYKFYNGGYTKYGTIDNKYRLDCEDDVAYQTWGANWRIPTFDELKELQEKCTFESTTLNGVPVTKVTGPNGNYIYFPYPGNGTGTTVYFKNSIGSYWSSDLESNTYAKDLDYSGRIPSLNGDSRYHGQSIRPVYVENNNMLGTVPDVIDLGLPSGTLWAAWNVGASSPEEYGAYFAWGETAPKDCYDWSTYKFGGENDFTKYNSEDGLTELELEDDAAYVILGKDWRMPTHEEELELVQECSWESVTLNNISGYKITGPNGNSIFMPKGGLYDGTDYDCNGSTVSNVNTCGWYWSSTLNHIGSSCAQGLCFFPSILSNVTDHERCDGHNIRPVYTRVQTPTDDNDSEDDEKVVESALYVDQISVANGQQITLPIYLNNDKDICNFQFDIKMPEGLTVEEKGSRIKTYDIILGSTRFGGLDHSITSALQDNGSIRVLVSSTQNTSIRNEDEEGNDLRHNAPIVNVTLNVASDVKAGKYTILIHNIALTSYINEKTEVIYLYDCPTDISVFSEFNITALSSDSKQGSVNISSDTYDANTGTANANESITVTATPNTGYVFWKWQENGYDVSTENPYTFTLTSDRHLVALFVMLGDVLEDGQVNVGDLTETAGYILRSETPDGGTMLAADVYKDGVINVGDFTSIAGIILNGYSSGVKSRDVEDARRKVVNLQFDIELPSGIGLAAEQVVSSLRQTSLGVNHGIMASALSDGRIRVLVVSSINAAVSKAEEALTNITIPSDMYHGTYGITLKNIVFAFNDYSVENIGEMSSTLLFAAPTGINGIAGTSVTDSQIYDINGRKQNKVGKGVNIINGRKVYKK